MPWALDLDGVMWLGDQPIAGSAEAVAQLREAGHDLLFVTNNSSVRVGDIEAKLAMHGVDAAGAVVTSAVAAATVVMPGQRVLVCGGAGVREAVEARGGVVVDPLNPDGPVDVVIVGLTRAFDYALLTAAVVAVREGAMLIGTNSDPTYPTPEGQIPGGGALVAAVATAAEVDPILAGKPHQPMVDLVKQRLGPHGTMVGDRMSTDGLFAQALGYRFVLVASGVSAAPGAEGSPGEPPLWVPNLAAAVARFG